MATNQESFSGKINRKLIKKQRIIRVAAGREDADVVLKNATYLNVFSNELCTGDIAVCEGLIVGMTTASKSWLMMVWMPSSHACSSELASMY